MPQRPKIANNMLELIGYTPLVRLNRVAEPDAAEIICKLERIFPPSFFDSMEHLAIHLPYEAQVGGPVQYRWMYPFERYVFIQCNFNSL